jgi:GxxExxY protein
MGPHQPIPVKVEEATHKIIGAAIEVHRHIGPGYLESIYEEALCREFDLQGLQYQRQVSAEVNYKGQLIAGQRLDLVVDPGVVVELKAIKSFDDIHTAQVLSYLKTLDLRLGLLINFNVEVLKLGVKRVVR